MPADLSRTPSWLELNGSSIVRWLFAAIMVAATWMLLAGVRDLLFRDPSALFPASLMASKSQTEDGRVPNRQTPNDEGQANHTPRPELATGGPQQIVSSVVAGRIWMYGLQVAACTVIVGLLLWATVALLRYDL